MRAHAELQEIREFLEGKQYTSLRQLLEELNDADIAAVMEMLPAEDMVKVYRILPKDLAADAFSYLETESQRSTSCWTIRRIPRGVL